MAGKPITPTFADWYPDPDTGGTRYWDGSRWTGDTRPPRRPFAAAAHKRDEAWITLGLGGMLAAGIVVGVFSDDPEEELHAAMLLLVPFVVAATVAVALYFFRGQGPETQAVESRLAEEDEAAKKRRRTANFAGMAARFGSRGSADRNPGDAVDVARIEAISDPETARALQNLQSLLYTRTITDEDYASARHKLLGADGFDESLEKLERLTELHRQGVLGDVEFSAAKARVLGTA